MVRGTLIIFLFIFGFGSFSLEAQIDLLKAKRLTEEGIRNFKQNRFKEAILSFLESYRISKNPMRLQNIARCHENLRDYRQAIEYLYEFVFIKTGQMEKTNTKILQLLPGYLKQKERIASEKIALWTAEIGKHGAINKLSSILPLTALTLIQSKLYEKSLPFIKEAIQGSEDKVVKAYFQALWPKARLAAAQELLRTGNALMKNQNLKAALLAYEKAFAYDPPQKEPLSGELYATGIKELKAGHHQSALLYFKATAQFNPVFKGDITQLLSKSGDEQFDLRAYQKALDYYEDSLLFDKKPGLELTMQKIALTKKRLLEQDKTKAIVKPEKKEAALYIRLKMKKVDWILIGTGGAIFVGAVVLIGLGVANVYGARDLYNNKYMKASTEADAQKYYSDFAKKRDDSKIFLATGITLGVVGIAAFATGLGILLKSKRLQIKLSKFKILPIFNSSGGFAGRFASQFDGAILSYHSPF